MTTEEAMTLIEKKRREAVAEGVEPYALLMNDDVYRVVDLDAAREFASVTVYDPLLQPEYGGVLWWNERDYEKAEEAWLDSRGL